ncbi:MAG: oxidoreductase [Ginsengibacter sp.]
MATTIKVGLIGFGVGGQVFHAPLLTTIKGLELISIRASKADQVAAANARYPAAKVVATTEEIFNDDEVNLVVISTPNSAHLPLAAAALNAGKHVVVDKPFTITTKDADELIALAKQKDRLLTVYHNRRFDGDFDTLKKIIKHGWLGDVVEIESRFDRFRNFLKPDAWREDDQPGAGILYDLGSHLIDQALDLFGLPKAVTADLRCQREGSKVTDNFEVVLHYDRVKYSMKAGMLVKENLPRFSVFGTQGSFTKYGLDVQEEALKAGLTPLTKTNWGVESEATWGRINTEYNGVHVTGKVESGVSNYADFYKNVYNAIANNEPLKVTAEQARNTIRIIELAIQSQAERRTIDYTD